MKVSISNISRLLLTSVFAISLMAGCGGGSSTTEATLGAGEGGVSAASSVSAVSATE
tara:strand:- start:347 stop:517 length:171 start_codon:yes stop_codon:yes gene_type:complete